MSSQELADRLIALVSSIRVEDFFISPGSRSQALVLAAENLKQKGKAKTVVRIDERSMSFTALGSAIASGSPVAMIVTSGTAVANLHPAMLEAHHAGVPLIAITADRPLRLRGKGSNQTTLQPGIFDQRVIDHVDLQGLDDLEETKQKLIDSVRNSQPLQLNVCFDLPLSDKSGASQYLQRIEIPQKEIKTTRIDCNFKGVVIAGAGGEGAREFAEDAGWPLFAEPSSGSRFGSNVIENYSELLTNRTRDIQKVVVFGKPTLNRSVVKLIESMPEIISVASRFGPFDIANNAVQVQSASASGNAEADWLQSWQQPRSVNDSIRESVITKIWDRTEAEDSVYLGASKIIRVADLVAPSKDISVFSNRGLAGIDGSISTAIGIALKTKGMTRAIIGDLTAIHDLGGMNLTELSLPNLQLWVVNDAGGKIFEQLEVKEEVEPEVFDKYFQTPQQVNFEEIATAMGWGYELATSEQDIEHCLDIKGPVFIEVRP